MNQYRHRLFPLIIVLTVGSVLILGILWYRYPWDVIRFPLVTGIFTVLICFLLMYKSGPADGDSHSKPAVRERLHGPAWLAAVAPFLLLFGFKAGFALYAFFYVFVQTRRWRLALATSAITFCLVFGIFSLLLSHPLPSPFWYSMLDR